MAKKFGLFFFKLLLLFILNQAGLVNLFEDKINPAQKISKTSLLCYPSVAKVSIILCQKKESSTFRKGVADAVRGFFLIVG